MLVIACSWLGGRNRLDRGLALAAVVTATCVIVVPQRLLGSFYADQRLVEPALVFALLAIGASKRLKGRFRHALFLAAILFAGSRLTSSAASLVQLGYRSAVDLAVVKALPRHAQMVMFRAVDCPPPMPWLLDRRTHLGGYALARRHAFSNDQWDVPGAQLLNVHNPLGRRICNRGIGAGVRNVLHTWPVGGFEGGTGAVAGPLSMGRLERPTAPASRLGLCRAERGIGALSPSESRPRV